MASRTPIRILAATLASLLVLPAVAYAQDDEPTLCDALDIAALSDLTGLEFEPTPASDKAGSCRYLVAGGNEGHYASLFVAASESYAELIVESRDGVEFEIADRAALGRGFDRQDGDWHSEVFVDYGFGLLIASISAPGIPGETQLDHTLAMARSAVDSMAELGLPEGPVAVDQEAVAEAGFFVPTVSDIAFYDRTDSPQVAEMFAGVMGVEPAEATAISLSGRPCLACPIVGVLTVARVSGAGDVALREAFSAMAASQGGPSEMEEAVVGGKDVFVLPSSDGLDTVLHIAGDTAYLILLEEAYVAPVLEALP